MRKNGMKPARPYPHLFSAQPLIDRIVTHIMHQRMDPNVALRYD